MCCQLLCGVDSKSRWNYIDIALKTAHNIFGLLALGSNETNSSLSIEATEVFPLYVSPYREIKTI